MKYLAQIQSEFIKVSSKWDDLSYEAQKEYLKHHPKSKRRITSKPGEINVEKFKNWLENKKFMNLETNQPSEFKDLPETQQSLIKKNFIESQKRSVQEREERRKAKPKKISEKKIERLGRLVAIDLKNDGHDLSDTDVIHDTAKNVIESTPGLKEYFLNKGVEEENVVAVFTDFIPNISELEHKKMLAKQERREAKKVLKTLDSETKENIKTSITEVWQDIGPNLLESMDLADEKSIKTEKISDTILDTINSEPYYEKNEQLLNLPYMAQKILVKESLGKTIDIIGN